MWSSGLRRTRKKNLTSTPVTFGVITKILLGVEITSGFGCFEQDSDQLRDVEVRSVVQGVHVGPAAPQTHVGAQRDQLRGETQRCRRVACTHNEDETKTLNPPHAQTPAGPEQVQADALHNNLEPREELESALFPAVTSGRTRGMWDLKQGSLLCSSS